MELYTVTETAAMLRVSPITIRRYITSGRLSAERVGRGIRVRREAIDRFIKPVIPANGTQNPESEQDEPPLMYDVLRNIVGIGRSGEHIDLAEDDEELPTLLEALGISVGIGRSGEPTNIAEHKDEYLADAIEARG